MAKSCCTLLFVNLKGIGCLGLLLVAGVSHASFELVLVADNGTSTNATRKIHRFDADSGVYLGSFGSFGTNISGTHVNKATNSLFVNDGTILSEWDYNTGAFKGTYAINFGTQFAVRPDQQRVAAFIGGANLLTYTFPTPSGLGSTAFVSGAQYRAGFWTDNSEIVAFDGNSRVFRRIAMNANADLGTATAASAAFVSNTFGQIARNAGTNDLLMAAGTELKVINTQTFSINTLGSPIGTTVAIASGHEGYFLASTGASALVTRYDRFRNFRGQYGSGILTSPVSMQTVLAPEPGTMIALGAGALALLRRRKKS